MLKNLDDKKVLAGCIVGSIVAYNGIRYVSKLISEREKEGPLIPIGVIKTLYIYPAKSCKGQSVFSFYCDKKGAVYNEMKDRFFQVIDGKTGVFYTARQKPQMVRIDVTVENNHLNVKLDNGRAVSVNLDEVKKRSDVRKTYLHAKLRTDGLDCGAEISKLLSEYLEEEDVRCVMYIDGLFTARTCITEDVWWNNNTVPKRVDDVAYADLAPYMIQTEGSLDALNERLDEPVTQLNFRPVIVVDKCAAWDEDKWLHLQFGDAVKMTCYKPCTRCILTTVNPETGKKHPDMQPLRELRQFRLAPEGTAMRGDFKDSPIFGVNAGVDQPGYIHVGQVVFARYKKNGAW